MLSAAVDASRPTSPLLSADAFVLLDSGAWSLVVPKRLEPATESIDAVVVSHLQGEHSAAASCSWSSINSRRPPSAIAGGRPPGVRERMLEAMDVLFPCSS